MVWHNFLLVLNFRQKGFLTMQNHSKIFSNIILSFILILFTITSYSASKSAKIVGGHEAEPYSYPFMVSIQYKKNGWHFCGGALISPKTVITAAHCTKGESAANLQVVVGEHNLNIKEGPEQTINVQEIVIHDNYNSSTMENDISILHLSAPVNLGMTTQLITLPEPNEKFSGKTTVIGWGALKSGGDSPDELNEVNLNLVDFDKCNTDYNGEILPRMVCAAAPNKDTCQGDSGGPLFQDNKLIGLTSWGYGCANPKYPGVYTEVSQYIDFITANMHW